MSKINTSYNTLKNDCPNWSQLQLELFNSYEKCNQKKAILCKKMKGTEFEFMNKYNRMNTLSFNNITITPKIALHFHYQLNPNEKYLKNIYQNINVKKFRVYFIRTLAGKSGFGIKFNKTSLQEPITPNNIILILRSLNENYIANRLNINVKDFDSEGKWEEFEIVLFQVMLFVAYKKNAKFRKKIGLDDLLEECHQRNISCRRRILKYEKILPKQSYFIKDTKWFQCIY